MLDGSEGHHLTQVLRCREGDTIELFDGNGSSSICLVVSVLPGRAEVKASRALTVDQAEHPSVLCLAQIKPKAMDIAIRMATEVGITHLVIFPAQRSNARGERLERWQRVATAAAKQCGRSDLPKIAWSKSLHDVVNALPAEIETLLIAVPGAERQQTPHQSAAILVGPEGGWNEDEIRWALANGFSPVSLGHWTLKAETAATLAAAHVSATNWDRN